MKLFNFFVLTGTILSLSPNINSLTLDSVPSNSSVKLAQNSSSASSIQGYCFSIADDNMDSTARIYIDGNKVTGRVEATIHNKKESYYTSYTQILEGTKNGNKLNLNITTKIELDTQKTKETWTLNSDSLNTGRTVYKKQPCLVSQVRFAPGKNSATVSQSVVLGSRNIYLLKAKQGQRMDLKITALENNAVFDVIAPNGQVLKTAATQSSLKLPATGNYEIVVGGNSGEC
ncbi:MAG: hypothetical protein RSE13_16105 [Planktothrix sp. GU0601_MAG3]|nr:MAG: hypothetical protein RSE13_16105 [Planktothrix sp. GU0601_MAG3]